MTIAASRPTYRSGLGLKRLKELVGADKRKPYEDDMVNAVRNSIQRARQSIPANWRTVKKEGETLTAITMAADLLKQSLLNKPTKLNPVDHAGTYARHIARMSFGSWLIERGILLGPRACFDIGTRVCSEMGFTVREAEQILERTPKNPHPME